MENGRCYLCGKWSKQLRYSCIICRDDMMLVYLCPDCCIYPVQEENNEKLHSEKV